MSTTPHDSLFKAVFSRAEHAAAALRNVLPPALAARIDFTSIRLEPGSFIDRQLLSSHSDLLFSALLAGHPAYLYFLYEHLSTVQSLMAFRMLRYMVRIWDDHLDKHPGAQRLPVIIPVVLHHSESGWTGAVAFEELLDVDPETLKLLGEHIPRFRFVLDDVSDSSEQSDEALRRRAMTALGRLALWCLRHARQPLVLLQRLRAWQDLAEEVLDGPDGADALEPVMWYVAIRFAPEGRSEVIKALRKGLGPKVEAAVMNYKEFWEESGWQRGMVEGQRSLLLKMLTRLFGELPEDVAHRVEAASTDEISVWAERVLGAKSLADVLGEG